MTEELVSIVQAAPDSLPRRDHVILAISAGLSCLGLFVLGAVLYAHSGEIADGDWVSVTCLFFIPPILELVGLTALSIKAWDDKGVVKFYQFYRFYMFCCLLSYEIFWILYAVDSFYPEFVSRRALSVAALLSVLFLLFPVIRMTNAILKGASGELMSSQDSVTASRTRTQAWARARFHRYEEGLAELRNGVARAPLCALLFFFGIFLGVSYLFSFAIAFHDKSVATRGGDPALYMATLNSRDRRYADRTRSTSGHEGQKGEVTRKQYTFFFESGSAALPVREQFDPEAYNISSRDPKKLRDAIERKKEAWRANQNNNRLKEMAKYVVSVAAPSKDILINVLAGADDQPFNKGERYSSNFEMSQGRIDFFRYAVMKKISEVGYESPSQSGDANSLQNEKKDEQGKAREKPVTPNIVWSFMPLSSELPDQQLSDTERENLDARGKQRIVLASLNLFPREENNHRAIPLNLMDYVYFMNYTITTTGYGDIVPTTDYAKFLCSFVNIIEVFFLVVFFNALFSSRGRQHETKERS
jgi:hypothetical protein